MTISLSTSAAQHVSDYLSQRGSGVGIRVGVRTTGCSGLAYVLEYADHVNDDDQVYESQGIKVLVDAKSLPYLEGTEMNYVRNGLNAGFEFNNPNSKDECGCGESFRV